MKLRTFESLTLYRHRYTIGYSLIIGLGAFLLLFKLGTLTHGLSAPEVASTQSAHLRAIWDNPLYAPYRLLQLVCIKVLGHYAIAVRLPSVIFGAATVFGIYLFLRSTLAERVAVMGALLVGCSTFLLGFSRLGIPAITLAWALSAVLGVSSWVMASEKRGWWQIGNVAAVSIIALYIPFGWFWLLLVALLHPIELKKLLSRSSKLWLSLGVVGGLLATAPLALAIYHQPHLLKGFVLWPEYFPSMSNLLLNGIKIVPALGWRDAFTDPVTHLGNLPLLDVFTSAMILTGALTLIMKPTLARTRILFIAGLVCLASLILNPLSTSFALLLPLIGILGAIGLERLLMEWYEMFPRNPFARVGALVPLALIFAFTFVYHIHRGFIAWPKAPETKIVFRQKI